MQILLFACYKRFIALRQHSSAYDDRARPHDYLRVHRHPARPHLACRARRPLCERRDVAVEDDCANVRLPRQQRHRTSGTCKAAAVAAAAASTAHVAHIADEARRAVISRSVDRRVGRQRGASSISGMHAAFCERLHEVDRLQVSFLIALTIGWVFFCAWIFCVSGAIEKFNWQPAAGLGTRMELWPVLSSYFLLAKV